MLRVEGVDAYYGLSHVLQGVSLTVEAGEAVALLGRNGAGKTTTLKTIMAVVRARRGRITWNGADITGLPPYRIVQAGIRPSVGSSMSSSLGSVPRLRAIVSICCSPPLRVLPLLVRRSASGGNSSSTRAR